MKTKKLISLILTVILCAALMPSFASVAGSEPVSFKMTEEQRAAKIEELLAFSDGVYAMRSKFAADYKAKAGEGEFATCRIIVKYKGELKNTGALAEVSGYNNWHVLQYASPAEAESACKQLALVPGVEYAAPDAIMHTDEVSAEGSYLSWGYNSSNVDADSMNNWLLEYYGGSVSNIPTVTVAVIDTGADSDHPFIMNRLVPGYDFSNNDSNPEDDHYHGTHVSGIVVDGTLTNVKIMPIKVLDREGYGETITVAMGIEYAYLHGCDVMNMSLGGDCDGFDGPEHLMMEEPINAAADQGTVVCVAAGNETDNASYHCPANVERAITVASITRNHTLSYFSNYGSMVDIMAPGSDVNSSIAGGGYSELSGTSMASPHVAAASAMVKSFDKSLGNDEIANILKGAAVDIGITNAGAGMLNVTDLFKFDRIINAEGQSNHFTSTGTYPWQVDENTAFSGNAGINNSTSALVCKLQLGAYQTVTFDYKVSSQQGGDYFRFKAGDTVLLEKSGEQDWQTVTLEVPASGFVTLKWEYAKDASGSAGSDRAYVRNISIQPSLSSAVNAAGSCIRVSSNGAYPWVADEAEGGVRSGNAGVNSSVSDLTANIRLYTGMILSFDYCVSSGQGDTLSFVINGTNVFTSGNTNGYRTFSYTVPADGSYSLLFSYSKDSSGSSGSDCAWVRNLAVAHTFGTAANANANSLTFTNNSQYPWAVNNDYVMSTNKGHASTQSVFTLTLAMQMGETLSFRYAVSSESSYDFFKFYVDNTEMRSASGAEDWTTYVFTANQSKTYTFKWSYEKDYSVDSGDDRAYVDDIAYSGWHPDILGDADLNGVVNASDALAVLRYSLNLLDAAEIDMYSADADGNGTVNASDALLILRAALGLIEL